MTMNLKMIVKWTEEYDLLKSSFIFIGLILIFFNEVSLSL